MKYQIVHKNVWRKPPMNKTTYKSHIIYAVGNIMIIEHYHIIAFISTNCGTPYNMNVLGIQNTS